MPSLWARLHLNCRPQLTQSVVLQTKYFVLNDEMENEWSKTLNDLEIWPYVKETGSIYAVNQKNLLVASNFFQTL